MRLLLVNTSDTGGGAQQIGSRLMAELRARGHEVTNAVGFRYGDDPDVRLIPNDEARPAAARPLQAVGRVAARYGRNPGVRLNRRLEIAAEPRRLARVLRGEEDFDFPGTARLLELPPDPPDLIHAHNLHGGYFDLRALPALSNRLPFVLTMHDAWLLSGHCAHSFDCEGWRTGCGSCPDLTIYPAVPRDATAFNWRRKRDIYARSQLHVATPCAWLRDRVADSILAAGVVETRVIPNGVDLATFAPGDRAEARAELGLPADADIVLFASNATRSNPFKDFAMLESVLQRLGATVRERPLLFVSVGEEGPSRRLGGAELRMVGHVGAPSALVPWYRAADLYLHPARADTFPTTVLEALGCGLPVIASAIGGIPEQVDDDVSGHTVAAGDDAAMAARVDALLRDDERRRRFGEAARAAARERFDVRRMVDDYLAWYRDLIDRGDRSASISESSRIRSA